MDEISRNDYIGGLIGIYKQFFEGIDLEEYSDSKLVERIEFLRNLQLQGMDKEELEGLSESVLDASAIIILTEGDLQEWRPGDKEFMDKETIENKFLKHDDNQVNNSLLELLIHAWYEDNICYQIEDFEQKYSSDPDLDKQPDFRLKESEEFIECKRISGDSDRIDDALNDAWDKFEEVKEKFPHHKYHVVIDIGSFSSKIDTDHEGLSKEDLTSEEIQSRVEHLEKRIENYNQFPIDKVTLTWLGSYIFEVTPWYSLHKASGNSFTDRECSSYEGWTLSLSSKNNKATPEYIRLEREQKKEEYAVADRDALGGVFFSQQAGQETEDE